MIGHNSRNESFTVAQNEEAYKRLTAGDDRARNELIEGNMALVVFRTDAYLRSAPQMAYYRDDMISAGFVGLCEAVNRMKTRLVSKPTGYIAQAIDRHIARAVDGSNTIVVPKMAQARARTEGHPIEPPRIVSERAALGVCDSAMRDRDTAIELQDEILACCQDDTERRIVAMRSDGFTDAQSSESLGLSDTTISRRRKVIFKRFNDRCPEYRETQRALAKKAAKRAARKAKRKTRV